MITVPNKKVLYKLVNQPKEGEFAVCEDTNKLYKYQNDNWEETNKTFDTGLTLYELNKSVLANRPPLTDDQVQGAKKLINQWQGQFSSCKFFMLLCRDLNYYTIFYRNGIKNKLSKEVVNCAHDIGEIVSIILNNDNVFEIWVKTPDNEIYCMFLFDYQDGVIEVN